MTIDRNSLNLIVCALVVFAGLISFQHYQERQKTHGIEISLDTGSKSIERK